MMMAFATGLVQVFLVALNQRQIANKSKIWRIVLVGGMISLVWIFNVHAAVGTIGVGAAYVLGAGSGTWLAMKSPVR